MCTVRRAEQLHAANTAQSSWAISAGSGRALLAEECGWAATMIDSSIAPKERAEEGLLNGSGACTMLAKHVAASAKAAKLKEWMALQRVELWRCQWYCRACRELAHCTMIMRKSGAKVILIAFCSFASGRVAEPTPYVATGSSTASNARPMRPTLFPLDL